MDMASGIDISTPETGVSVGGSVPGSSPNPIPPTNGNVILASDNDQFGMASDISVPGKLKASMDTVCDTYSWFLNGVDRGVSVNKIEIDTTTMEPGRYQLEFIGSIGGSPYSKELEFEVQ
jgi:hypothetical protein